MKKTHIFLIPVLMFLLGCATSTAPNMRSETWTTNKAGDVIHEVKETKGAAFITWGDAAQVMEKLRITNGKTHGIGITGYEGEASATNVAPTIDAAGRMLGTGVRTFFGVP